jgi:large subunit ribosomal protein L23
MALFGFKKKKVESTGEVVKPVKTVTVSNIAVSGGDHEAKLAGQSLGAHSVIIRPRITEKASRVGANGVFVFEVNKGANKKEVATEIQRLYKVKSVKVNFTKNPSKLVFVRGKIGKRSGVKKAYVYLKEGEKIEIS